MDSLFLCFYCLGSVNFDLLLFCVPIVNVLCVVWSVL